MIQIKKTILTLALLITAVTGARADQLASSYSSDATLNNVTVSASMEVTIATGVTVTINNGLNITSGTLTVTGPGTLVVTGAKGNNGASGWEGSNGSNGGVAISGNIIVQGGATVTATGGTGGNGGWGEDMERSASSGSAGKAFANDVDFTQTTGYSVTNGTSTIESVLNQRKVVISGGSEPAAATTYTVSLKDGVKDADKWTISPNPAEEGQTVTLKYNGRLKVKGVTATTDAGAPAAAMPMLTLGSMPNGGDPFSGSSGSETDFSPTFSEGQQVAVFYQNTSGHTVKVLSDALTASDISNEGKSATINVTIDDADKTQPVTYFYPATMTNDDYPSLMAKGSINFNFKAQSGTEASLSTVRNCCKGSGAWDGNALPSVSMASQIAIWKLTMTHVSGMIAAQKVTVKVGGNKVAEASASGTYFAYPIDIYLALNPATMGTGTLRIEADEFGTIYYYQKDGGVSLTAGKFYQSAVELKR